MRQCWKFQPSNHSWDYLDHSLYKRPLSVTSLEHIPVTWEIPRALESETQIQKTFDISHIHLGQQLFGWSKPRRVMSGQKPFTPVDEKRCSLVFCQRPNTRTKDTLSLRGEDALCWVHVSQNITDPCVQRQKLIKAAHNLEMLPGALSMES